MQSNLIRAGNRLAEIMPSQVGAEATITRIGTINTVYDTGGYWTADVDMSGGTLMGLQMTTDCVGARAGDRCVVETYAKVAIVTGILARPGGGCSPLFEWSSTWSGTPGTEPESGYLEKTATVTCGGLSCARLRPRSAVPANTVWRSTSWTRTVSVKRIGVPRRRRRTAAC